MNNDYRELLVLQKAERYLSKIRPYLESEGSSISIKDYKDGVLYIYLEGACIGCAMSKDEFPQFSSDLLKEIPEVKRVEYVNKNGLPVA